ncbi:MAG: divalent-cation tolerance protein CutA [Gammaproteobacteria bacterium]|nr:divalent-cation tolerance protein CutA [Gammaproteobacteria bacterium]MCK5092511.1 divalent-cation tolerance protein CutA [Gammaproteobacteria bacterium]
MHSLIFCTCPDQSTAEKLAHHLIDESLAACVNILPGITSVYQWEGKRETGTELLLLIKTREEMYAALEKRITELHPYELPEIISVSIKNGLPGYMDWITQNTGNPA